MSLLDIFKKKQSFLFDESATSNTLKKISKDFDDTASKLLAESQELLNSLNEENTKYVEKAKLLKELGFTNSQLVIDMDNMQKKLREAKSKKEYLDKAKSDYPNYKYIPEADLKKIIDRYKMVIGKVSEYKGYVPDNNLKDIQNFFKNHPDDSKSYFEKYSKQYIYENRWSGDGNNWYEINKYTYERKLREKEAYEYTTSAASTDRDFIGEDAKDVRKSIYSSRVSTGIEHKYDLKESPKILHMCASPELFNKDKANFSSCNEPIVMMETTLYGGKGYIIITAWGDDLPYDPAIYNEVEEHELI